MFIHKEAPNKKTDAQKSQAKLRSAICRETRHRRRDNYFPILRRGGKSPTICF